MNLSLDEIRTIIQECRESANNNALCYCGEYVKGHGYTDHSAVPIPDSHDYDLRLLLAAEQLLAEVERLKRPSLWQRIVQWFNRSAQ